MACKYVKDFSFESKDGFTGSAGKTQVKGYYRGGNVTPDRSNAGGAMRGLERAAAMSGRTMPERGNQRVEIQPVAMKKGGAAHSDVAMDKKVVAKAVHKHEKAKHSGEPLTKMMCGGKYKK